MPITHNFTRNMRMMNDFSSKSYVQTFSRKPFENTPLFTAIKVFGNFITFKQTL